MKFKQLLTPLLLLPTVASAHPGHDHAGLYSSSLHLLSGAGPHLIFSALAVLAVAAIWLVKSR